VQQHKTSGIARRVGHFQNGAAGGKLDDVAVEQGICIDDDDLGLLDHQSRGDVAISGFLRRHFAPFGTPVAQVTGASTNRA